MSLTTIRDPILRDLGLDSSSSLVADSKQRILDYINEAIQELNIMNNWEILKSQGTFTLATDTATYALASDADVTRIVGERFYLDSEDSFVYKIANNQDFQEFVIQNNGGKPLVWVPWGKNASQVHQIKVDPVPTLTENGLVMTYWYTRDLTDLSSDSDTTPFQEVVVRHMVKAKYAEYDQDFNKRDREMSLANSLLRKLLGRDRGSVRFVPLTRKNYRVAR
tara:strand:+ start:612 stop:1277 length:666 start_codon:yes stop_codon:yes gene_type:complete